ncbi:MAG: hypothetical protein AAGC83_04250, partial [Pseudomonadota bacterium]
MSFETNSLDGLKEGTFVGRVWRPDFAGPSVVTRRNGQLFDSTSRKTPTVSALLDGGNPASYAEACDGQLIGSVA